VATEAAPVVGRAGEYEATAAELRSQIGDVEGLDTAVGLRNVRGNREAYLRLLRQFDSNHGADMSALESQLENGETDAAVRLAHTLKGAAGTLGLIGLQREGRRWRHICAATVRGMRKPPAV